jgi:uncharacterized protein YunC (DUF1805 family)
MLAEAATTEVTSVGSRVVGVKALDQVGRRKIGNVRIDVEDP